MSQSIKAGWVAFAIIVALTTSTFVLCAISGSIAVLSEVLACAMLPLFAAFYGYQVRGGRTKKYPKVHNSMIEMQHCVFTRLESKRFVSQWICVQRGWRSATISRAQILLGFAGGEEENQ